MCLYYDDAQRCSEQVGGHHTEQTVHCPKMLCYQSLRGEWNEKTNVSGERLTLLAVCLSVLWRCREVHYYVYNFSCSILGTSIFHKVGAMMFRDRSGAYGWIIFIHILRMLLKITVNRSVWKSSWCWCWLVPLSKSAACVCSSCASLSVLWEGRGKCDREESRGCPCPAYPAARSRLLARSYLSSGVLLGVTLLQLSFSGGKISSHVKHNVWGWKNTLLALVPLLLAFCCAFDERQSSICGVGFWKM